MLFLTGAGRNSSGPCVVLQEVGGEANFNIPLFE